MRAKPQNMAGADPNIVFTSYKYITDDPRHVIEKENYFLNCKHMIGGAGDEITVRRTLDDGSWEKGLFEVTYMDDHCIVVSLIMEWRHGGMKPELDLKGLYAGDGKWDVVYRTTMKPYRSGIDKAEAELLVGMKLDARVKSAENPKAA